jgi:hypothetical protein
MLPILPPNPLNPFGVVSSAIATAATVAGLGAGLAIGAVLAAMAGSGDRRR